MEVKTGYKQTEVGLTPDDWQLNTLSNISIKIGDGIHSTPIYSTNGEYFFINGNNLYQGHIRITSDTKTSDFSEFKKHGKNLGDRTLLLSINGTIGNLAVYRGEPVFLGKSAAYLNIVDITKMVLVGNLDYQENLGYLYLRRGKCLSN